jgi:hypothetical protein
MSQATRDLQALQAINGSGRLRVTVRNRTSLPIDGLTFMLRFPETGSDTSYPIGYQYQWGATMLKKRNPLSSEDRSPGIPLNLLPQQTATVDFGVHYQEYSLQMELSGVVGSTIDLQRALSNRLLLTLRRYSDAFSTARMGSPAGRLRTASRRQRE